MDPNRYLAHLQLETVFHEQKQGLTRQQRPHLQACGASKPKACGHAF